LSIKKPFYLHPPWNILFDFSKLEKITPWDVSISFLLTSFLEEMEKQGEIDFRASGVALDSSAFLYLMKSKLLLKLEEPVASQKVPSDFLPPPLFIPLRYELTSTTIQQLLDVLDDVLKGERLLPLKIVQQPVLPSPMEILPQIDLYLMEIEEQMEKLYETLCHMGKEKGLIIFSKIVEGLERIEAIRTFIVLLFLAQRKKVDLWQDEEFGEIYITLPKALGAEGNGTEIG
jgi:segregation and condensation protein A